MVTKCIEDIKWRNSVTFFDTGKWGWMKNPYEWVPRRWAFALPKKTLIFIQTFMSLGWRTETLRILRCSWSMKGSSIILSLTAQPGNSLKEQRSLIQCHMHHRSLSRSPFTILWKSSRLCPFKTPTSVLKSFPWQGRESFFKPRI